MTHGNTATLSAAVSFADGVAALLSSLRAGDSGVALRTQLKATVALLRIGDVRLELEGDSVRANGRALAPATMRTVRDAMQHAALTSVTFDRETSDRELLLFAALLVAPGDRKAFRPLWLDCGAWRIHVSGLASVDHVDRVAPPSTHGVEAHELRSLCAAIGEGGAAADPTLLDRLRERGADATKLLLEQLAAASKATHRRALFEAIRELACGAEHIVAALRHPEWFVVRNAAALLGELRVLAADEALAALLKHRDARVRAAAITSLGQLGTETAHTALFDAVLDTAAPNRVLAWRTWAVGDHAPPAWLLDTALRRDEEPDAQRAMLACASAFPTLDVTGGLVRFCARALTRGSTPDLLAFGVEQLALRRPQSATAFVKRLPQQWSARVG